MSGPPCAGTKAGAVIRLPIVSCTNRIVNVNIRIIRNKLQLGRGNTDDTEGTDDHGYLNHDSLDFHDYHDEN